MEIEVKGTQKTNILLQQMPHTHLWKPCAGGFASSVLVPFVPNVNNGRAVKIAGSGMKGPVHLARMGVTWVPGGVQEVRRFIT